MNPIEQSIKQKIELVGTPLKEWDVNIYRGILTGYNDAFIIDGHTREKLINMDAKSAEIIRPILRGRDVKRYSYQFAYLYIIATFPSLHYDIDEYPAVKEYLLSYGMERLEQTGAKHIIDGKEIKSRKKTRNKWFETQDSISYWDDFSKQKIVWGEISDKTKFALDENGDFFCEATTFLMTGSHLKYLLCFLNSNFSEYYFSKIGTTTGVGTVRWKKFKIETLPVPIITPEIETIFEQLLDNLLSALKENLSILEIEQSINTEIYNMLNLNDAEISFIENFRNI